MEYEKTEDFIGKGIWHVTTKLFFSQIMSDGEIKAEPKIPDDMRYNTAGGPKYYSFVRRIGGISLFDFSIDKTEIYSYNIKQKYNEAVNFLPKSCNDDRSDIMWIEIDREAIKDKIITSEKLIYQWKSNGCWGQIIPGYEIAVIGSLATSTFIRVIAREDTLWIEKKIKDLTNK